MIEQYINRNVIIVFRGELFMKEGGGEDYSNKLLHYFET